MIIPIIRNKLNKPKFVAVCVLENYGDDFCEFENDAANFAYEYEYIKTHDLSHVFCEIKEFLVAYKILCKNSDDEMPLWYEKVPKNLEF
jgi:hypothetical protein